MTLLRRAPREVYRVYDEQEFFAEDARKDHFQAPVPDTGVRWMHRVAGATVLLAVIGTVGGVIFIAGAPSAKGGGRWGGAGLAVATRSLSPVRARALRVSVGRGRPSHESSLGGHAREVFLVGVRPPRKVNVARASLRPHVAAAAPRLGRTPVEGAVALASVAQSAASVPTSPRQADPSEFGFER